MKTMNLKNLMHAICADAAIRRLQILQPVGGLGDKIFPPTYPSEGRGNLPSHVFERRRIDDGEIWCVLVDSVQSQANRLEEALLDVAEKGLISLPYITVDFEGKGLEPLERITSLDAPHRVYDAILRDSSLKNKQFMETEEGQRLTEAKLADATALLELSPSSLLFGAWNSQGEGGGMGAKFSRVLVSEIMGINVPVDEFIVNKSTGELGVRTAGKRTGSRIDPLGILRKVEIYKGNSVQEWSTTKGNTGEGAKSVRPSEIGHSNIPPTITALGVTCHHIEHRATITLAGLRKLRFGGGERDVQGRTLIASLGLLALLEQCGRGYALRSRCDLVCEDSPTAPLELVHADGSVEEFALDLTAARNLYQEAYKKAKQGGFKFRSLTLKPQKKLIEIIQRSRQLALEGKNDENKENE